MTNKPNDRRGLGRGLSALMGTIEPEVPLNQPQITSEKGFLEIPIENIIPNPNQPRKTFDADQLAELAASIKSRGVIQPLVVRPSSGDKFEIVAGERRWRAAQIALIHNVPVVVRDIDDQQVMEIAIIENIQRADLNPLEEAAGYQSLATTYGYTSDQLAGVLGKSRSHVANTIRLLNLPEPIRRMVEAGELTAGHARALLNSQNPVDLARRIADQGLTVRQAEALARDNKPNAKRASRQEATKDTDTIALEQDLSANLGMGVVIDHRAGGEGRVMIRYSTIEQLDQLCQLLSSAR